jgi:adenylylsulfate reductase subunit B
MPSFVIQEKCDGCKGGDKTACMYICPNDLMVLDPNAMKAYNQEPDQCWECFSCVKICPTQAIEVRGYADFVPLGSSIMPMMGTEDVMWTCKFRNGLIKRFKFPIRTTPEGRPMPMRISRAKTSKAACFPPKKLTDTLSRRRRSNPVHCLFDDTIFKNSYFYRRIKYGITE